MTQSEAAFVATERFVIRGLSFIRHRSFPLHFFRDFDPEKLKAALQNASG
jgi:hypothetical protein